MTVQPQDVPRVLGAVGNVKASASVGLTPRVTGEIEKVHFTEGQDVKEGDVLLTIDTRPFEATLREKKGQLAKSEAQLHKATNDAGRYGKLVGNGYVSREAYEQTATEAAALRATVQADKAAVESAALDLSYCTLRAPISGRVGGLKVDKGNMVRSSDTTPIVSLDTLSPIYVTFSVPERHLSLILDHLAKNHRLGIPVHDNNHRRRPSDTRRRQPAHDHAVQPPGSCHQHGAGRSIRAGSGLENDWRCLGYRNRAGDLRNCRDRVPHALQDRSPRIKAPANPLAVHRKNHSHRHG